MVDNKERPVLETFLETTEVIADILTEDGVLASVPIIGTAFRLVKASDAVRDRVFAAKLSRFVEELGETSTADRDRYMEKLRDNPDEAKRVGETIILVLEQLNDLDKPEILARVFIAYMDGVLTVIELRRFAQAIGSAFIEDLRRLLLSENPSLAPKELWMELLAPYGLTEVIISSTVGASDIFYQVSPLGRKLREAYFHGQQKHT